MLNLYEAAYAVIHIFFYATDCNKNEFYNLEWYELIFLSSFLYQLSIRRLVWLFGEGDPPHGFKISCGAPSSS